MDISVTKEQYDKLNETIANLFTKISGKELGINELSKFKRDLRWMFEDELTDQQLELLSYNIHYKNKELTLTSNNDFTNELFSNLKSLKV